MRYVAELSARRAGPRVFLLDFVLFVLALAGRRPCTQARPFERPRHIFAIPFTSIPHLLSYPADFDDGRHSQALRIFQVKPLWRHTHVDERGQEPLRLVELARDDDFVDRRCNWLEFAEGECMEVVKGPSSGKAEDGEPFVCGVDVADADGTSSGLG